MLGLAHILLAPDLLPLVGDLLGGFLILGHHQLVSSLGNIVKAHQLDRRRGAGFFDPFAKLVFHRPHPSETGTGHKRITDLEGTVFNQYVGDHPFALVNARLQHYAVGTSVGIGFELHQLRFNQYLFKQFVDALPGFGRYLGRLGVASIFLDDHIMLGQLVLNLFRVCIRLVDLVDRHNDRNTGRLCVVDRLDRLRHHGIIGGYHQNYDVGGLGPSGAHRRKRLVPRGIQECDPSLLAGINFVCTHMLRNTPGFTLGYLGFSYMVQQRGFSVIDVTHDGDDG